MVVFYLLMYFHPRGWRNQPYGYMDLLEHQANLQDIQCLFIDFRDSARDLSYALFVPLARLEPPIYTAPITIMRPEA